ncbi:hypothetical protein L6R53_16210 [Myxococcota bacterium]|nr:hypothetical protein [Myxococcota bacterium]
MHRLLALSLALSGPALAGTSISADNLSLGQVSMQSSSAGSTLTIDWLEVDGQRVHAVSCTLPKAPLLGAVIIGPALGVGVKAAQACQKSGGAAAKVSWSWDGAATGGLSVAGPASGVADCVSKAMATMPAPLQATCSAVVLLGERAAAEAAAKAL